MINILILSNCYNDLILLSDNIRRCDDSSMCTLTTTDVQEALSLISQQTVIFDMFVVNMQLPSTSGYSFEEKTRKYPIYRNTPFIFLTKNEHDLDSYHFLSTYESYKLRSYLRLPLKPLEVQSKFCLYLDSIFTRKVESYNDNQILRLQNKTGTADIPINNILYMEIQNKICTVYTTIGKFFIKRVSLSTVLEKIDSSRIIRCHRFYAINTSHIDYIEHIDSRKHLAHLKKYHLTCPIGNKYLNVISYKVRNSNSRQQYRPTL